MCGIAGFYQSDQNYLSAGYHGTSPENPWRKRLIAMRQSLRSRGPNDENTLLFHHAGLAHTRLAIRDILGGKQPMSAQYRGRSASIVYNGEIYNTCELREELEPFGMRWSTTGDTEVILNGFLAMGTSFFEKLNGIFAFAIYVHQTKELYLVRDSLGVKPLFYSFDHTAVVFGSEPKALFAYGIHPAADRACWNEIFALGPARTLGNGGFAGMHGTSPRRIYAYFRLRLPASLFPKIGSRATS